MRKKLRKVGNVFLRKREVSPDETIERTLSLQMRLSIIAEPQEVLQKMYPEDTNIFANGITEKYAHRPDGLENACYADFATGYVNINTKDVVEEDDIENYFNPVNSDEEKLSKKKIIVLKNGLGKMRKGTQSRVKRYHKFS